MKLVIGIAGLPLAGKETAADELAALLQKDGYTVSRHRFSDILRETLDIWGIPHGRANEQKLAIIMNHESGFTDGALPRAMKHRLSNASEDVAILDGMRWLADETMLRAFPKEGLRSLVVYINASEGTRYERLEKRNRANEAKTTRKEFAQQNTVRTEVEIPDIGSRADIIIENEFNDRGALQKELEAIYKKEIRPLL